MFKKILTVLFLSFLLVGCSTNDNLSSDKNSSNNSENNSTIDSSSNNNTSGDSTEKDPQLVEKTIELTIDNFESYSDKITFTNVTPNTRFGNIALGKPSKGESSISSDKLQDVSKISFEVYTDHDNIQVFTNDGTKINKLTATDTSTRNEGDKLYVTYNYSLNYVNNFKLVNAPNGDFATYLSFVKITYRELESGSDNNENENGNGNDSNLPDIPSDPVIPSEDLDVYYQLADGKEGIDLYNALHKILNTNRHVPSYGALPNHYEKTDSVNKNGQIKIIDFYTHELMDNYHDWNNNWNREHVWPKSLGSEENQAESDLHHVRPDYSKLNGFRSNHKYGDNNKHGKVCSLYPNSECYLQGNVFEPNDVSKGDCARIIMYCAVTYNMNISRVMDGNTATIKATLLKWNELDPVDDIEMRRNNEAYKIQGNRNVFIDRPEYLVSLVNNGLFNR